MRLPLTNLPVPGPADVLGLATAVREGLEDARELVPRAADLISRAGALVARIESLLDAVELVLVRVESLVDQVSEAAVDAGVVVGRVTTVADGATQLLARASTVADGASELVGTAEVVTRKVDRLVEGGSGLLDRSDHLLSGYFPVLNDLMPVLRRVADSLSPDEVDATIGLLDRLPALLNHIDEDVLPMLQQLDRVGPDVHEILQIVDDLRDVIAGLPGAGLLRKMGDRKEIDAEIDTE